MRTLFSIAVLSLVAFSCGEAGIGFNVNKELPVDAEFTIPGPPVGTPILGFDPPATEEVSTFELSEVSENIDDLGSLSLNNMSYEITDVSSDEEVDLDEISIKVMLGGTEVTLINLTGTLQNTSKTAVELTSQELQDLESQLFNQKELDATITVDLAELPDDNEVTMTFRTFYDVTLKIRQ